MSWMLIHQLYLVCSMVSSWCWRVIHAIVLAYTDDLLPCVLFYYEAHLACAYRSLSHSHTSRLGEQYVVCGKVRLPWVIVIWWGYQWRHWSAPDIIVHYSYCNVYINSTTVLWRILLWCVTHVCHMCWIIIIFTLYCSISLLLLWLPISRITTRLLPLLCIKRCSFFVPKSR